MNAVPDKDPKPRRFARAGFAAAATMALAVAAAGTAYAQDGPEFAAPDQATVKPGVMTYTNDAQCTANFVFTDGTDAYIGQAAHCAGTGAATDTNGCEAESLPLGTPVEVEGADNPGTLAYSSWISMKKNGEKDPNACQYNDFALVKLDPADVAKTSPTMPYYGGPQGVDQDGTTPGEIVFGYGNSSLRQGIAALRPKTGTSVGTSGEGWTHTVGTVGPGIPGDSGSGYMSQDGKALGVLSTLNLAPAAGTNGLTDVNKALEYANTHGGYDGAMQLVDGQEPFNPNVVPLDTGAS